MRPIVSILVLCLMKISLASAAAVPPCPTQPGLNKENDLHFLQIARAHVSTNAACIERLLRYISYYTNDPRVVSVLIDYLDFPTVAPPIAVFHAHSPEMDKFPAIYSLVILGEPVGPQLIDFLLYKKPDSLKESNALKAYMDAYGVDPLLGIKEFLNRSAVEDPEISRRRHALAAQAAALCRSDVREQCLSAVSESK